MSQSVPSPVATSVPIPVPALAPAPAHLSVTPADTAIPLSKPSQDPTGFGSSIENENQTENPPLPLPLPLITLREQATKSTSSDDVDGMSSCVTNLKIKNMDVGEYKLPRQHQHSHQDPNAHPHPNNLAHIEPRSPQHLTQSRSGSESATRPSCSTLLTSHNNFVVPPTPSSTSSTTTTTTTTTTSAPTSSSTSTSTYTFPTSKEASLEPAKSVLLRGVNLFSSAKVPRTRPVKQYGNQANEKEGNAASGKGKGEGEDGSAGYQIIWEVPSFPASWEGGVAKGEREAKAEAEGETTHGRMFGHINSGFWEGQELGGESGWFNGSDLDSGDVGEGEDSVDEHLRRLRGWGFNVVRWLVTWEALEHAGPGKYDDEFIAWTVKMLYKLKEFGFRVYIDPHQDVWSRATGGSGAPFWTLLACGLAPRRFYQTGAAYLQNEWPEEDGGPDRFPSMIWQTNLHRLAARTAFTCFFAGRTFAPKVMVNGVNIQDFLEGHFIQAFGRLADAIAETGDLLDTCVIGWDSINEPGEGFLGIPNLNDFPPSQDFKKGPSPTPIQSFNLGVGRSQKDVEVWDFNSLGPKKTGKTDLTPVDGQGCWLTKKEADDAANFFGWKLDYDFWGDEPDSTASGDIWAAHGVWDRHSGKILESSYFHHPTKNPKEEYDFTSNFWVAHWAKYLKRIRESHPQAISFCNPPVFAKSPSLDPEIHQGRMCLSAHFYDGMTLLGKRRHLYNADAVAVMRGIRKVFRALKFGDDAIRKSLRRQFGELGSDASQHDSMGEKGREGKYPVIIGETGVPYDMKKTGILGLAKGSEGKGDYTESARSMDNILNGCDGVNALSYTIWCYEPYNTYKWGDGWNGENLSIWSAEDLAHDDYGTREAQSLSELLLDGARGVQSFCRPYAVYTVGELVSQSFNVLKSEFKMEVRVDSEGGPDRIPGPNGEKISSTTATTVLYLPYVHYRAEQFGEPPVTQKLPDYGQRIRGEVDPDERLPWKHGEGKPYLEVDIQITEGKCEIIGQYAYWSYPTGKPERRLKMSVRRTEGSLYPTGQVKSGDITALL